MVGLELVEVNEQKIKSYRPKAVWINAGKGDRSPMDTRHGLQRGRDRYQLFRVRMQYFCVQNIGR